MSVFRSVCFVASSAAQKKKSDSAKAAAAQVTGAIQLMCHVTPGASKVREGIISVSDESIRLCVAAPPREGESNKAVISLLSEVLEKPKSDIQISRGGKSRDKTIVVSNITEPEEEAVTEVMEKLNKALE